MSFSDGKGNNFHYNFLRVIMVKKIFDGKMSCRDGKDVFFLKGFENAARNALMVS